MPRSVVVVPPMGRLALVAMGLTPMPLGFFGFAFFFGDFGAELGVFFVFDRAAASSSSPSVSTSSMSSTSSPASSSSSSVAAAARLPGGVGRLSACAGAAAVSGKSNSRASRKGWSFRIAPCIGAGGRPL
jgi:hypothetical protein